MEGKGKRTFSIEFKREAVELASRPGASVAQVARDLGVTGDMIHRWRRALRKHGEARAFVGQGVSRDEEVTQLRREVALLRKERDFLKSAAAYFAKDGK